MALEFYGRSWRHGLREAWFTDVFGRHELHLVPNEKADRS
jgi:hypothetical protein